MITGLLDLTEIMMKYVQTKIIPKFEKGDYGQFDALLDLINEENQFCNKNACNVFGVIM